jgi:hypothetical protein
MDFSCILSTFMVTFHFINLVYRLICMAIKLFVSQLWAGEIYLHICRANGKTVFILQKFIIKPYHQEGTHNMMEQTLLVVMTSEQCK